MHVLINILLLRIHHFLLGLLLLLLLLLLLADLNVDELLNVASGLLLLHLMLLRVALESHAATVLIVNWVDPVNSLVLLLLKLEHLLRRRLSCLGPKQVIGWLQKRAHPVRVLLAWLLVI